MLHCQVFGDVPAMNLDIALIILLTFYCRDQQAYLEKLGHLETLVKR